MAADARHAERPGSTLPIARKLLLAIGFLSLAIGALLAWDQPIAAYELSIYTATPIGAWIAIAIAFGLSALVCIIDARDRVARIGVLLGGFTVATIVALPLIRNYRYYGLADALTHLGWTEDLWAGRLAVTDLLYPGGHMMAVMIGTAFELTAERAILVFITVLVVLFMIFVPLAARALVPSQLLTVIAAFSGFMLLPFYNISTAIQFHAYSIALLLLPAFLYLMIKQLMTSEIINPVNHLGIKVVLTGFGAVLLFLHPQVMLNVVILLVVILFTHVYIIHALPDHPLSSLRPSNGVTATLGAAWIAWSTAHWQVHRTAGSVLDSVYMTLLGEQQVGQTTAEIGVSAAAIGVSLWEFYGKLFLVSTIYVLFTLGLAVAAIVATLHWYRRPDYSVITYVGCAGVVLVPFFLLHYLGDVSGYFFRHLGFAMVVATIFGAVGMYHVIERWSGAVPVTLLRTLALVALTIAMLLSALVIFPSPWVYLSGFHVSDQEMQGYEIAFSHADDDLAWSGIRSGPGRFFDALTPATRPPTASGYSVRIDDNLPGLLAGESEARYLPLSDRDIQREVIAYRELAFSAESLATIHHTEKVNHIQTNGGFDLYYLPETNASASGLTLDIVGHNAPITAGEELHVQVELTNTGDTTTEETVTLSNIAGDPVSNVSIVLDPGESETITMAWVTDASDAGTGMVTVTAGAATSEAEVEIREADEAASLAVSIEDVLTPVEAGNPLNVEIRVENTGETSNTQGIDLLDFDGEVVDSTELSLSSGDVEHLTLSWDTDEADVGTGGISVRGEHDSDSAEAEIIAPPRFMVAILVTHDPVTAGEDLEVDVRVTNEGMAADSQVIELRAEDGTVLDDTTTDLDGGEEAELTLSWTTSAGDAGEHEVTAASEDAAETAVVHVESAPSLDVTIADTNSPVEEGDDLTVEITVENTGETFGEQEVVLRNFDDDVVDTTSLGLEGGESTTVTLVWETEDGDAGEDTITVASDDDADAATVEIEDSSWFPFF